MQAAMPVERGSFRICHDHLADIEHLQHSAVAPDACANEFIKFSRVCSLESLPANAGKPKCHPLAVDGLACKTRIHATVLAVEPRCCEARLGCLQLVSLQPRFEAKICRPTQGLQAMLIEAHAGKCSKLTSFYQVGQHAAIEHFRGAQKL